MKMEQCVSKRRRIKFRRRGITQKKAYKVALVHSMKTYNSRGTAPPIHILGNRWRWLVNIKPTPRRFNLWVGTGADVGGFVEEKISWSCQNSIPGPSNPCLVAVWTRLFPGTVCLVLVPALEHVCCSGNQLISDTALSTSDCRHTLRTWCAVLPACKQAEHKTSVRPAHTRTFCPACNGSKAIHWKAQKCGLKLAVQSGCHPEWWSLFQCRQVFELH